MAAVAACGTPASTGSPAGGDTQSLAPIGSPAGGDESPSDEMESPEPSAS
jgi:hypothetical protein